MALTHQDTDISPFRFQIDKIVEGFMSGLHESPFKGFSSEFEEHKQYTPGQSVRHMDWKLFARTDKLYLKQFSDETNLRCHFILDQSNSMFYPQTSKLINQKIGFSLLSAAALSKLLMSQRDSFGFTLFNEDIQLSTPVKNTRSHYHYMVEAFEDVLHKDHSQFKRTNYHDNFKQIANMLPSRSVIILFSDLLTDRGEDLLDAFKYFKFKKHHLIVFNTLDFDTELNLDFNQTALNFKDVEYGTTSNLHLDSIQESYQNKMSYYFQMIKEMSYAYNFLFHQVDIKQSVDNFLKTYFIEKQSLRY